MREMIMLRDYNLQTKTGHSVRFVKNKPVRVHPLVIEDAIAVGATFVDGSAFIPEERAKSAEPSFGFEREQEIYDCCMRLADSSSPDDFTANGIPKLKAMARELGYEVDRVEVDGIWRKVLQARSNQV
jgi:hypothetical protein